MFTKEQIIAAHSKVKSGADFPGFVREIKGLGVKSHEVVLSEGMSTFRGADGQEVLLSGGPEKVYVSPQASPDKFKQILLRHQRGETDYPAFCIQAGETGVEKWISDFESMTVTYLDLNGNTVDVEPIPGL